MFGKPHWFREKRVGWGLRPVKWQGWAYAPAWTAVLGVPFAALLLRYQATEAFIWLTVAATTLLWDVREIRKVTQSSARSDKDVLYIGDEETDVERLATRNYKLQLRR